MMQSFGKSIIWSPFALILLAGALSTPVGATVFTVGPDKTFATPEQIEWSEVHPGDKVVIYPGTYPSLLGTGNSMALNGVKGTAAKPITVEASSAASIPKLDAGIVITGGSEFVTLSNLDVSRPVTQQYAAVVVQGSAANIVLSGLNVHDSFVGVEFTETGLQNVLRTSQIYDNLKHGVTAAPTNTAFVANAGHRSLMTGNVIHDNGAHGIEITGSYWTVEHNRVTHNGGSVHGTSGIHIYSSTDVSSPHECSHNVISYNYLTGQQDLDGTDGNGIQVDDFCDYNTMAFNVLWANAGAGISVLDSMGNVVFSNTSYSNATDTGRVHKYPGVFRGEIILGSMANLCSNPNVLPSRCHVAAGRSSGNVVQNNLVVSGQSAVPGVFVSPNAAKQNSNYLYQNMYHTLGSSTTGIKLLMDDVPYYTAETIDAATGQSARGDGNLVETPYFKEATAPATGGLELTKKPTLDGAIVKAAAPDMLGVLPKIGDSRFGAYYKTP
jgi:parallel beta-helix repeat protein